MATIPTPGSELRHVRKTITFTGGAGAGAIGTATIFTLTGRVRIERLSIYCTTSLTSGGAATINCGSAATPGGLFRFAGAIDYTKFTSGNFLDGFSNVATDFGADPGYYNGASVVAANPVLTIAVADVTGGVLVIDGWYTPITDDGALAGDDIDQDSRTWTWATALSDIAAVPAITASALSGLNWLFALARNKRTQTATTETVYKDDGSTSLSTSTKSDDGTTFTRGKYS